MLLTILSTFPWNCNRTTSWNMGVLFHQFTTVLRCQKCHRLNRLMQSWNIRQVTF